MESELKVPQMDAGQVNIAFSAWLNKGKEPEQKNVPYTTRMYVALTNWRNKTCNETTGFKNYATKAAAEFAYLFLTVVALIETIARDIFNYLVLVPILVYVKSEKDKDKFEKEYIKPLATKTECAARVFLFSLGSLKANCSSNFLIPSNFGHDKENQTLIPEDLGKNKTDEKKSATTPAPDNSSRSSNTVNNNSSLFDDDDDFTLSTRFGSSTTSTRRFGDSDSD